MIWSQPNVYDFKHKDEEIRAASRSGGIFTALSDLVLDDGGTVYGCVLTDDFHILVRIFRTRMCCLGDCGFRHYPVHFFFSLFIIFFSLFI